MTSDSTMGTPRERRAMTAFIFHFPPGIMAAAGQAITSWIGLFVLHFQFRAQFAAADLTLIARQYGLGRNPIHNLDRKAERTFYHMGIAQIQVEDSKVRGIANPCGIGRLFPFQRTRDKLLYIVAKEKARAANNLLFEQPLQEILACWIHARHVLSIRSGNIVPANLQEDPEIHFREPFDHALLAITGFTFLWIFFAIFTILFKCTPPHAVGSRGNAGISANGEDCIHPQFICLLPFWNFVNEDTHYQMSKAKRPVDILLVQFPFSDFKKYGIICVGR